MWQSIQQLFGTKLGALDGEIGHVKDFYFDDQSWAVRYLVADTGTWLTGRQVLIAPHALGNADQGGKNLMVNLTRKQIEDSPAIEAHKPVSRQYEEEYYRYFGWPYYWQGEGLWGLGGTPILETPAMPMRSERVAPVDTLRETGDAHLRSAKAVNGYHLSTTDGIIGHVHDFRMDDESWAIQELVIKTGHRFTGKEIPLSVTQVDRISYEDSTVFVKLSQAAIEHLAAAGAVA